MYSTFRVCVCKKAMLMIDREAEVAQHANKHPASFSIQNTPWVKQCMITSTPPPSVPCWTTAGRTTERGNRKGGNRGEPIFFHIHWSKWKCNFMFLPFYFTNSTDYQCSASTDHWQESTWKISRICSQLPTMQHDRFLKERLDFSKWLTPLASISGCDWVGHSQGHCTWHNKM